MRRADDTPMLLRQSIPLLRQSGFSSGHLNLFPDGDDVDRLEPVLVTGKVIRLKYLALRGLKQ